jgi:hypothetical protein
VSGAAAPGDRRFGTMGRDPVQALPGLRGPELLEPQVVELCGGVGCLGDLRPRWVAARGRAQDVDVRGHALAFSGGRDWAGSVAAHLSELVGTEHDGVFPEARPGRRSRRWSALTIARLSSGATHCRAGRGAPLVLRLARSLLVSGRGPRSSKPVIRTARAAMSTLQWPAYWDRLRGGAARVGSRAMAPPCRSGVGRDPVPQNIVTR